MTAWTMSNTEGFTQSDLDMINRVRGRILEEVMQPDGADGFDSHVDDVINNVWVSGISEDELEKLTMKRLGH